MCLPLYLYILLSYFSAGKAEVAIYTSYTFKLGDFISLEKLFFSLRLALFNFESPCALLLVSIFITLLHRTYEIFWPRSPPFQTFVKIPSSFLLKVTNYSSYFETDMACLSNQILVCKRSICKAVKNDEE